MPSQRKCILIIICTQISHDIWLLRHLTLVGKALSFTHELFFFLCFFLSTVFYQSDVLSSCVVDGRQMYFGGSVVGKNSTIGRPIGISPTPPLIFTGGQKVLNWRRFNVTQLKRV